MNQSVEAEIREIIPGDRILVDEPMKKHTTFRIGGPARLVVRPENIDEIIRIVRICRANEAPYLILGNGSNVLVSDCGIDGVVILFHKNFDRIEVNGSGIKAQAGALLSSIGNAALENSLTGFEFACGIPGTIGGACIMNAGAYGGEMKDILSSVTAMDEEGNIREYLPEEMELSYRDSIFQREKLIVLEATVKLSEGNKESILGRMKELAAQRREKQPLELPSAGSTFKRPQGYFAGKLIMDAGLRGFRVGDAAISEKHCGFVVNMGNASAGDICDLMRQVSQKVEDEFGVRLEPEVRMIGKFD